MGLRFHQYVTFVGAEKMTNPKLNPYRRAFWIILIAASFAFMGFHIYTVIHGYHLKEFITDDDLVTITHEDFPSITICDSEAQYDMRNLNNKNNANYTKTDFPFILTGCLFGNRRCLPEEWKPIYVLDRRLCFEFKAALYRSSGNVVSKSDALRHRDGLRIWTTKLRGGLIIYAHNASNAPYAIYTKGAIIFPTDDFSKQLDYDVRIQRTDRRYIGDATTARKENCSEVSDRHSINENSHRFCFMRCFQEHMLREKKCYYFPSHLFLPSDFSAEINEIMNEDTVHFCRDENLYLSSKASYDDFEKKEAHCANTACGRRCEDVTYELNVEIEHSVPRDPVESCTCGCERQECQNPLSMPRIHASIFYERMSKRVLTLKPNYDFFIVLSQMGGALGLIIGLRGMNIIQFIDWFIIRMMKECGFHEKSKRKRKVDDSSKNGKVNDKMAQPEVNQNDNYNQIFLNNNVMNNAIFIPVNDQVEVATQTNTYAN